jgi:uncharacterized protein YqgV (UPF0045/DUF77 family)
MKNKVNVALQILPTTRAVHPYRIIDKAISVIQKSGIRYMVCPFETVLEGDYGQIMELLERVQMISFENGALELFVNIKIHIRKNQDVTIEEKMEKYF